MKYQIWNGTDNITTLMGKHYTSEEWKNRFPWVKEPGAKMIIGTGKYNGGVALEFEEAKEQYKKSGANITDDMSDDDVLIEMEKFDNCGKKTDKIYAVFGGCYSDWKVYGYFSTQEEALSYCERANRTHVERYSPEDLYVKELKCIDGSYVTSYYRKPSRHLFRKEDGEWKEINFLLDYDVEETLEVYDNRKNYVTENEDGSIKVIVYVSHDDIYTDKVDKIARDELFRYLAEREGL